MAPLMKQTYSDIEHFSSVQKISVTELGKALSRIANFVDEKGYQRAIYSNFIIVHTENALSSTPCSKESENSIAQWIDELSLIQPSRFFVLRYKITELEKLSEEVPTTSVWCKMTSVSKSVQVCSEIIELAVNEQSVKSIISVINAHLLPVVPVKLLFIGNCVPVSVIASLASLTRTVIIDAATIQDFYKNSHILLNVFQRIVDLQWIHLSSLREQIRLLFDRPHFLKRLQDIEKVQITTNSRETHHSLPLSPVFIVSWFLEKMSFEPVSRGFDGIECIAPYGSPFIQQDVKSLERSEYHVATTISEKSCENIKVQFLSEEKLSENVQYIFDIYLTEKSENNNPIASKADESYSQMKESGSIKEVRHQDNSKARKIPSSSVTHSSESIYDKNEYSSSLLVSSARKVSFVVKDAEIEIFCNDEPLTIARFTQGKEVNIELLKRYFLLGESTSNYRKMLEIASSIYQLEHAFQSNV
jgi:glucose-6-phosphate dehydrogenase assembly protein OpcA